MVSLERLRARFEAMRVISAPSEMPGICRLAFTDSDWRGRAYLTELMREAGLAVREDAFGNVVGRMAGRDDTLPPVVFGSHADSVPNGGNYDGVLGVLAAIETMQSLREEGFRPEHPLEAALFMCEESSRFGAATLGSRAMLGALTAEDARALVDSGGVLLYDALAARGLSPDALPLPPPDAKAFFEVHIEQGRVLEHTKTQIGIVTGIAAPTRMRVRLVGRADHSGATPMALRHDSACAAAEIILAAERLAKAEDAPPVVATVGVVDIAPGAMNVIPGEARLGVDIRSIDGSAKARVARRLTKEIEAVCARRALRFDITPISEESPVRIRPEMLDFLEGLCKARAVTYRFMPSGAGHDAMHWAARVPTGMLFIPCKDGVSHNAAESAELADILTVTALLESAVKAASARELHLI